MQSDCFSLVWTTTTSHACKPILEARIAVVPWWNFWWTGLWEVRNSKTLCLELVGVACSSRRLKVANNWVLERMMQRMIPAFQPNLLVATSFLSMTPNLGHIFLEAFPPSRRTCIMLANSRVRSSSLHKQGKAMYASYSLDQIESVFVLQSPKRLKICGLPLRSTSKTRVWISTRSSFSWGG